jgi:hypothetical protein
LPLHAANACPAGAEHGTLKGGKLGSNRLIISARSGWLEGEA